MKQTQIEIQHTKTYRFKAVLKGKVKEINAYIKEKRKISNNLPVHFKELENEGQNFS